MDYEQEICDLWDAEERLNDKFIKDISRDDCDLSEEDKDIIDKNLTKIADLIIEIKEATDNE